MQIVLKVSCTRVFKNHTNSVTLRFKRAPNADLCPIVALWNWWAFTVRTDGAVFGLSKDGARRLLQQSAAKITENAPGDFGLHSLRSGGATDADKQGCSLGDIKSMSRWKSKTVLQYIRNSDIIAKKLGVPQPRGSSSVSAFVNTSV